MIPKNVVIAFLIVTAVIISCALALIETTSVHDKSTGATARAGYYVVATTKTPLGSDLIWIANVDTQQLMVRGTNKQGDIIPLARTDLRRAFNTSVREVTP